LGTTELFVRPFPGPGGTWQISTGGGRFPVWSRNGRELFFLGPDQRIRVLNRNGVKTGRGNRWTRERVTSPRSHQNIPYYNPEKRKAEGWMNLTEAAAFMGLSPTSIKRRRFTKGIKTISFTDREIVAGRASKASSCAL